MSVSFQCHRCFARIIVNNCLSNLTDIKFTGKLCAKNARVKSIFEKLI